MSILSYTRLLKLLDSGVVEHSGPEYVNGASIDVTLGANLLLEIHKPKHVCDLRARTPLCVFDHVMGREEGYLLLPGEFVLAHTEQVFNLPNSICANFQLKSSGARIGLTNLLAGWCDPGWHGSTLTLELQNCTRHTPILLRPGDRIGQMVFHSVEPVPAKYAYGARGRYNGDISVNGVKP